MNIQEKIAELEKQLAELKNAVEEKEIKQEEPKYERVAVDEPYYYISLYNVLVVENEIENRVPFDNDIFESNNYFYTKKRAEEVVEKIKMLLKLERLHDIYCPDYVPNWDSNDEKKYYVYYNNTNADELYNFVYSYKRKRNDVCFPTEEIAQKVCDILNTEIKDEKC